MSAPITRAIVVLYLAAVIVFIVGVVLRFIGGGFAIDELSVAGTLLNAGAWPIAVVGAILDTRHRRHLARAKVSTPAE